ncbi:MAG: hypothetical protein KDA55_12925, partial [Planctomycetales bacterium]|nr:hypothetical protein [Planctomycetales bacterium]
MRTFAFCIVVFLTLTAPARAVVIDFQSLETAINGQSVVNPSTKTYTEKGFTFSSSSTQFNLAVWGTLHANYLGSTALWNGDGTGVSGITTLTKVGGGAFDLLSIDLGELRMDLSFLGGASVTFNAIFQGGGAISQTFNLDGTMITNNTSSFETFNFSGFNKVVSVSWLQVSPYHQFDNVTIRTVSPVPIPAIFPIFAAVMGLFGFVGWR